MTQLSESLDRTKPLLTDGDLASDEVVVQLLEETRRRRRLDLSDLDPDTQVGLLRNRVTHVIPSEDALRDALAAGKRTPQVVKLGIDPTAADLHLGHAVPIVMLSRFQRMGQRIVFIVGDITASIGDPSGRSDERPPLTEADIASNMLTWRQQVAPFFDFDRADFRRNSEWLARIELPELLGVLSKIPVSAALQRDDFRQRLAGGHGLSMAEFMYSVVMALDSVKIASDIELGGVDQLLNLQMGRTVMEISGQRPQLVVTMPLVEGTDGSGAKMSKSLGNHIALTEAPGEMFGRVMAIPDRLIVPYLRAWTEWTDAEIDAVGARLADGAVRHMDFKRILAGDVVAGIHGLEAASRARQEFAARFSRRSYSDVDTLPVLDMVAAGAETVGEVVARRLGFAQSISAARRLATQNGLRFVFESDGGQESVLLTVESLQRPLADALAQAREGRPAGETAVFLRAGRQVARIQAG
jgi:tyrosyl-tRNA synthetase